MQQGSFEILHRTHHINHGALFRFSRLAVSARWSCRMKCVFALLLFMAAWVHADLTIEEKIESESFSGTNVTRFKGDQVRMDGKEGGDVEVSVLMNAKAGEIVTLLHKDKKFLRMSVETARKQAAINAAAAGIDQAKTGKPKATGKKEIVGKWEAEIYELKIGGKPAKYWIVKDFPNYKSIMDLQRKIGALIGGTSIAPSKLDFGGMVVKSEMDSAVGKVVITLVRAEEETLDDSIFALPEGYDDMMRAEE
jgi:Domain of unknown function (DUF4412)